MRSTVASICLCLAMASMPISTSAWAQTGCTESGKGLSISRVIEIDASSGPIFGHITRQASEESFLGPKEVVLTFDDGPMHRLTPQILDTLDAYCTKATFFVVGQMALSNPMGVREVLARGHTVGTHTWSHPLNIARLPFERAKAQIESGFAAATLAAGRPVAPFFRFPGLSDSRELMAYLQERGIASFTVDVVSNDSYIADPARLTRLTLERLRARGNGIILFHDIKAATARALPDILAALKAEGYKVVHLRAKLPYVVPEAFAISMREHAEKLDARAGKGRLRLLAFTDPTVAGAGVEALPDGSDAPGPAPVVALAPAPKMRVPSAAPGGTARGRPPVSPTALAAIPETPKASEHRTAAPASRARVRRIATSPTETATPVTQKRRAETSGSWFPTLLWPGD